MIKINPKKRREESEEEEEERVMRKVEMKTKVLKIFNRRIQMKILCFMMP